MITHMIIFLQQTVNFCFAFVVFAMSSLSMEAIKLITLKLPKQRKLEFFPVCEDNVASVNLGGLAEPASIALADVFASRCVPALAR